MNSGHSQAEILEGNEPETGPPDHGSKCLLIWELPAKKFKIEFNTFYSKR